MQPKQLTLAREGGATIAYQTTAGIPPTIVYCGGLYSDMTGSKATALATWCNRTGRAYIRFDYQGHGASSGEFKDGTIGLWRDDALAVLDQITAGPVVLVGSSMGAWIALLMAIARPARVKGLVLVAPAVDFAIELMWDQFDAEIRRELEDKGVWYRQYADESYPITMKLIEESRSHLLLGAAVPFTGPVHILHGLADDIAPFEHAMRTVNAITAEDLTVTLIKGGDHRLSTNTDLARLMTIVAEVSSRTKAEPEGPVGSSEISA